MSKIYAADAIALARLVSCPVSKHCDPTEEERDDLTADEAEALLSEDGGAQLVYVDTDDLDEVQARTARDAGIVA